MKFIVWLVGIVVALVVLVVVGLPFVINTGFVKDRIAGAAEDATGRVLAIDGDISLSLFPSLSLDVSGVRLANAEGGVAAEMVSIGSLSASLDGMALIGGSTVIDSVVIRDPAIYLEADAGGRPNWELAPQATDDAGGGGGTDAGDSPVSEPEAAGTPPEIRIGLIQIENGAFSMRDATGTETIVAEALNIELTAPSPESPLSLKGGVTLNGEPVTIDVLADSFGQALAKERFTLVASIESALVTAGYDGAVEQSPVPGLDGSMSLDIGSVGALASWLGQPLPEDQPDPGPFKLAATLAADGSAVTLSEATLAGDGLNATASGSFERTGQTTKIVFNLEGDRIDIDRYLPPPKADAAPVAAAPEPAAEPSDTAEADDAAPGDLFAALPSDPIDLTPLKTTQADIKIKLGGISAMGYEVGPIDVKLDIVDGVLSAFVDEMGLYDGKVNGWLSIEPKGDGLVLDTSVELASVPVGRLAEAAQADVPVVGVASGTLAVRTEGASPRALAQGAAGRIDFSLTGMKSADPTLSALSEVSVLLDLPGVDAPPDLKVAVLYNGEKVDLSATTDPLSQVIGGDRFAADLSVASKLVNLAYKGAVQQRPVPGLDGDFNLDIGSVGALASWLGQPLPDGQPDPGPLAVRASLSADGPKIVLSEAVIEGEGLNATATGSLDASGDVRQVAFTLDADSLDIDRYLPPQPAAVEQAAAEAPAAVAAPAATDSGTAAVGGGDLLAGLSTEPFDLAPMRGTDGTVAIRIGQVRAMGYEVGPIDLKMAMDGGVHRMELAELGLYGGGVTADVTMDASGADLGVDAAVSIANVAVAALADAAKAAVPITGNATGTFSAKGEGANPRALAEALSASIDFALTGVEATDAAAGLSELTLKASLPGFDASPKLDAEVVYNGERVTLALGLDPIPQVLGGDRFDLDMLVASNLIEAAYKGAVQQNPVPGLDGDMSLAIGSVGALAAWLGQPLPDGQPDPGPLNLQAKLAADGAKVALESAVIEGGAFNASATGSFDGSGEVPVVQAALTIDQLDVNAYLPPQAEQPADQGPADAGGGGQPGVPAPDAGPGDWSDLPIDIAPLYAAQADIKVTAQNVLYKDLTIETANLSALLDGGVLNAVIKEIRLAGGTVVANATIDGSGGAIGLDYDLRAEGLQALPLLKAFADTDRLSGTMMVTAKGTARGATEREIVSTLNGDGVISFTDGAIEGINIAETLREVGSFGGASGGPQRTDFSEMGGTFTITDGVVVNDDLKMLAPLLRIDGAGAVPMPPRIVDYGVTARLVASLEGQGGTDALAGIPIPVAITGPWHKPDYNVDMAGVFEEIAKDPTRLAVLPANVVKNAAELGIDLPVSILEEGGGAVGGVLEALPDILPLPGSGDGGAAGGSDDGGVLGVLENLIPGASGEQDAAPAQAPAPAPAPAPTASDAAPAPAPAPAEEEAEFPDPIGILEGLLDN